MSHSTTPVFASSPKVAIAQRAELVRFTSHAVTAPLIANRNAKDDGVAIICHELRNSLAVIRAAARLLRSPAARDGIEARTLIDRHVCQMSGHIDDLLEPRRRGGLDRRLQLEAIDVRVIVGYAVAAIAPDMARRGHSLAVKLPDTPIRAYADGARLEQAFANLLINAAKYTPHGGDIVITVEHCDDHVLVRVRDSGIGIAPAMLPKIFGMFVRVASPLPASEGGHGIGLAVVRELVELHGGTVEATSSGLGTGSEFTVKLPAIGTSECPSG
jgi:signal transduction histidine kinase